MQNKTNKAEIKDTQEIEHGNAQWIRTAYNEKQRTQVQIWLKNIIDELEALEEQVQLVPSVKKMKKLLETNGVARMYVTQMLEQSNGQTRAGTFGQIITIDKLLKVINYIVTRAPKYNPDPQLTGADTFPMSSLFTEMMATEAGEDAFRNQAFNDVLTGVLQAWCDYLDSPQSTSVLNVGKNGWLSPSAQKYTI